MTIHTKITVSCSPNTNRYLGGCDLNMFSWNAVVLHNKQDTTILYLLKKTKNKTLE